MNENSMFLDSFVAKYPMDLIKKRIFIEPNLIACLWKSPELYNDLKDLGIEDFVTKDGVLLYKIGLDMFNKGIKEFDDLTIMSYIEQNPQLKPYLNLREINNMKSIVNLNNFESYYDDLVKYNTFLSLHDFGFNVVGNLPTLEPMTSELVYQYFDYQLNNVFVKKQLGVKTVDLTTGYGNYIKQCKEGVNKGVSFASTGAKILSYVMNGVHDSTMSLVGAESGKGKSSYIANILLIPLLEAGEKIVLLINEEEENDWRNKILATVVNNRIKFKGLRRQKIQTGNLDEDDDNLIAQAEEWLKQYEGNIQFIGLNDYSIKTIRKIIKKYSRQRYKTFIYDTLKPDDETNDSSWKIFIENSKDLYQITKKEKIKMICTVQLSISGVYGVDKLSHAHIARAKGIVEVCSQVQLFRPLSRKECENLQVYQYAKNEEGRYTHTKQFQSLNPDKNYIIIFITKNRFGEDDLALVYERDLSTLTIREVGYCDM